MSRGTRECERTYRLVANSRRDAPERSIEFNATGEQNVFLVAEKHFIDRDTEVFSDGRALCRLYIQAKGGYWVINPPRKPADRRRSLQLGTGSDALITSG